ncbi:MAG: squalene--hopene cyclase, partial [Planctomycetales bacterium]|nr:squalene--hopene cyclase [Planctomycetales bacterium]
MVFAVAWWLASVLPASAQGLRIRTGTPVPIEVKQTSEMALEYLVKTQSNNGTWQNSSYGQGPGVDGICCLALLSSGEDPNYGIYADAIRKALRSIISKQSDTGLLSTSGNDHGSMYHHGFGTLALAEAYGA